MKLFYDEDASNLNVTVVGAESLAPKETTTPPNPYVRIYFLPDKRYTSFFIASFFHRFIASFPFVVIGQMRLL